MKNGLRLALALAASVAAAAAPAQTWPQKPVRLVVSAAAGGSLDIPARAVAEKLRDRLGQPVIVENRPAAGGTVAVGEVARAAPDGYTLIYSFNGPLAYAPFLYSKLSYDVQKDLTPVILMGGQPFVLGVSAASGISSVKELIEAARKQPGKLNYSSLGNGSGSHLTMELLKSEAKVFMIHIPYNGAVPAATAVASGDVQAAFLPPAVLLPHVQSGRVKLIGISSSKRFSLMPDVPAVAESGLPGFDSDGWNGILAPAGTPREIVLQLNREINDALAAPDVREILVRNRIQAGGGTPEEFGALIARESKKWGPVIAFTGARLD
ncbi:MAG TPA: tripartite tricarboxylate transporter substrate binding protein [Gemmatimonadales bacterium]|nr:tripartite tricarboxylate transporter substrate binding protein [Gemmatimonadales bacterium]